MQVHCLFICPDILQYDQLEVLDCDLCYNQFIIRDSDSLLNFLTYEYIWNLVSGHLSHIFSPLLLCFGFRQGKCIAL